MSALFLRLWIGQFLSNLGTQISFYGIGLWLFRSSGQFGLFAVVALVVQVSRIITLPLMARGLSVWPKYGVMKIAYVVGGVVTVSMAASLLLVGLKVPFALMLFLMAVGAMAEAVLVLCFASLIPQLVGSHQLGRANGLFATADGLVYLLAPFLGALLLARLGLTGVVLIDACSYFFALLCVSAGAWESSGIGFEMRFLKMPSVMGSHAPGFRQEPRLRALILLGAALMVGFAAAELLFPAWVLQSLGPDRLSASLVVSALAYALGMLLWQSIAGQHRLWPATFLLGMILQALVLSGAALQWFQERYWLWLAGVALFNLTVPLVLAAQQSMWHRWVEPVKQPAWFAMRYGWDWAARLAAVACSGFLVDKVINPLLPDLSLSWLGDGPGRSMAVGLGLIGLFQIAVLAWQAPQLVCLAERRS